MARTWSANAFKASFTPSPSRANTRSPYPSAPQDALQEFLGHRDLAIQHGRGQVIAHQHGECGAEDGDHGEAGNGKPQAQVETDALHGWLIKGEGLWRTD